MSMGFEAIDRSNLGDVVYQRLANALLRGALRPGQRLRIRDLAQQLGTSSTPVRDAVNRLVHQGALVMQSPRDIRVPAADAARYIEIRTIRMKLEGLAAERAAEVATPKDIAVLEAMIAENERAFAAGDYAHAAEINQLFHFAIAEIAGMTTLTTILHNLWLQSGPLIAAAYSSGGRVMLENHYTILEAIRANDPDGALQAVQLDLQSGGDVVLGSEIFDNSTSLEPPVSGLGKL